MTTTHFTRFIMLAIFSVCTIMVKAQDCSPLTRTELREKLVQLGYTVNDLEKAEGKEKFEVVHKSASLNVPVAYEISPSTNFIWLTVFLGPATNDTAVNNKLLRENFNVQPCQFYITGTGKLMMGIAVENRGVTNAILKRHTDFIVDKVENSAYIWQKKN
ncbi:MAG: hypothetical protein JST86_14510 [Bacteroidetes bacterium]|nr:hypothetical protein [Bacteroidota bacterium]